MAIRHYWPMAAAAVGFRLVLVLFVAEGYWLKQASMSPYSGSMYHGSPLLLSLLGPLTSAGHHVHVYCRQISCLIFVAVDFIAAMLIRATGHRLNITRNRSLNSLELTEAVSNSGASYIQNAEYVLLDADIIVLSLLTPLFYLFYQCSIIQNSCQIYNIKASRVHSYDTVPAVNISAGDIASLIYLWNPWAIVTCVGSCTSPIENLMVVIMIYGACSRLAPLAAFGYVMSTHLTLYPAILIVPIILLLGYGPDTPPAKVFRLKISSASKTEVPDNDRFSTSRDVQQFMWKPVFYFVLWMFFWSCYVLLLSSMILNKVDGLQEMFEKTYGFILTVKDLSPNIGVLWYFFAEVFDSFRSFFLIVINMNIVFMVLPLAIRLKHRPCFLAFVYTAIVAMLKSYPSVGDSALYLGLLGLFATELAEMKLTFFLFFGYIGVSLLSPVMHNLWIWRGTGNANFYFATGLAYTCIQTVLVVESVSSMIKHDRKLRLLVTA
ncbi:uncharacterized protein [Oryza sativa Japonica Group]|uniref:uncharacterized protein n=1 Tax=Oryza sativa subsp. japonica TaxID=39947 RepID=UPI00339D22B0